MIVFLALALSVSFAGAALADDGGFRGPSSQKSGGFSGPSRNMTTVEQAKTMRDDTKVVLRGNIVEHIAKDKYLFKDGTGSIIIEIDDDDWNGVSVTPKDVVEIRGEVDKDWNSVEIDVDRVIKP
ncbi:YgiW/YdeI family stress tolerance OB fold protein [Desulfovibrio sp. OttesenSCG-928-C14]|nr:YgiW/YdeI family stress tolerance OB fold protein [Desulfovibrio sp. OttesenSCG-928-C14]